MTTFVGVLILSLIIFALWYSTEYFTWHPAASSTKYLSQHVNMPRFPGERLSVWSQRVIDGLAELSVASDEFLEAAYKEGFVTHEGPRVQSWHLPNDHPAAIRYAKAKGQI